MFFSFVELICVVHAGGTHLSVPRFVKQLKAHKEFREGVYNNVADRCREKSVDAQVKSVVPDIAFLEEQVVQNKYDGPLVFNSKRQNLLHLMSITGSVHAVRALVRRPSKAWDPQLMDATGRDFVSSLASVILSHATFSKRLDPVFEHGVAPKFGRNYVDDASRL
jgi:hypothetical protein